MYIHIAHTELKHSHCEKYVSQARVQITHLKGIVCELAAWQAACANMVRAQNKKAAQAVGVVRVQEVLQDLTDAGQLLDAQLKLGFRRDDLLASMCSDISAKIGGLDGASMKDKS